MSKGKKPARTKAYRAKPVNPNAMNWALAGAYTLPQDKQDELIGYVDVALDALRRGVATREDWNSLANGANISEALAYFQIGSNFMPAIAAAQDALHSVALRMLADGRSTCYAAELAAINEGRLLYKIQMGLCSQAEMMRAVSRVTDLHRCGAMKNVAQIYERMAA